MNDFDFRELELDRDRWRQRAYDRQQEINALVEQVAELSRRNANARAELLVATDPSACLRAIDHLDGKRGIS